MAYLLDELEVGRHPRPPVEAEFDHAATFHYWISGMVEISPARVKPRLRRTDSYNGFDTL
ncbi:hypothetical protein GCM10027187_24630 [Streptosporangium sandarakinum]